MTALRTAMILAAGEGRRLAPLTNTTPKPMLDIHGKPLIVHQLGWLKQAGIKRVVVNLFHLGEQIQKALGSGERFGLEILYSNEPELLETGGGIAFAQPLLGSDPFLLLNGDIWTNFDFRRLPASLPPHLQGHLVVVPTPANRAHGDFQLAHRRLQRPATEPERRWVYCGIAVLRANIVGQRTGAFSLRDPLFDAAGKGELAGTPLSLPVQPGQNLATNQPYWSDIGTLDALNQVRDLS